MDLRILTSLQQMTILLVILSQIITLTHMLPVDSHYRRLDLDLLLDPIHQEMQEDNLESKRVVPKSVYNTALRITTESPCHVGTQRAKEGGPCLRINSSQGSVLDDRYLSAVLKDITRQGAQNGRRKHNRNRNRSTTSTTEVPVVQSTLQQDQDGVGEDDTLLVDLLITSTNSPPSGLDEVVQTYEIPGGHSTTFSPEEYHRVTGFRPGGIGVMDSENEDALIPKTSTVRSTKPHDTHESVQMTSTITSVPTETISPQEISTQPEVTTTIQSTTVIFEGQTEVPDVSQVIPEFFNAKKNNFPNQSFHTKPTTTLKPDSFTSASSRVTDGLVTRISTGSKQKTVNLSKVTGENVTATDVRVINFPPTLSTPSSTNTSNSFPRSTNTTTTERNIPMTGHLNQEDVKVQELSTGLPQIENESFTATMIIPEIRTNRPPIIIASIVESDLARRREPQVKSHILGNEEGTRTNGAAGVPISLILADKNSTRRFNFSETPMTETTTQKPMSQPQSMHTDVQDFEILVESTTLPFPEDSSSDFPTSPKLSSDESKIDQNIGITDSSPVQRWVEEEDRRVTAKLEEPSFTEPNNVIFPLNEELLTPTNMKGDSTGNIRFEDEETTTFETPRETPVTTRKRILVPFVPHPAPHIEEGRSFTEVRGFQGRDSFSPTTPSDPQFPQISHHQTQSDEEGIDKMHHKSRTRNRMRNPDLEDVPPSRVQFPDEFFIHHQQHQQQPLISRDLQKQQQTQVVSKPIVGAYPQFISHDYLRLGDNYRRFRVF